MIVARSYSPPSSSPPSYLDEKNDLIPIRTRSPLKQRSRSPRRSPNISPRLQVTPTSKSRSSPVVIPTRKAKYIQPQEPARSAPVAVKTNASTDRPVPVHRPRKESAQDILIATAIPARPKSKPKAGQRLPKGDYVTDFSKLLFEDIQAGKDGSLGRHQSSFHVEGLFGHIDELVEGQMYVAPDSVDETALSTRSLSSDSLASLASHDDYGSSNTELRSQTGRSPQGRLTPRVFHAEDCSGRHPLAELDENDTFSLGSPESGSSSSFSSSRATSPQPQLPKRELPRSTFKSTLTSSLKALKSAARTTLLSSSSFGAHGGTSSSGLYSNESLLAHNFFDIQPSLTDDRRPPPSITRPSPELRRYLNPQMASVPSDSPTQLHFWQDERHVFNAKHETQLVKDKIKQKSKRRRSPGPKSKVDSLPPVVPLSTCLPPTIRTAHASSPPIWLTPDGEPINKNTSNPLLFDPEAPTTVGNGIPRNREPRENRDFLRMYVCEMSMRRSGKLSDDVSAGRARLWLPPLSGFQPPVGGTKVTKKAGAERWQVWTPEDLE